MVKIIDSSLKHKFHGIDKRSKYLDSVYISYNSKVVLQNTICTIAQFYSNFAEIYFPVRLDQRGCESNF